MPKRRLSATPGLLHSEEDFEAVRARLAAGDEHALRLWKPYVRLLP